MKQTTTGTSHFVSRAAAVRYYLAQGLGTAEDVDDKLREGAIHIGEPELKEGQTLSVIDNGTRYAITERMR